MHGNSTIDVTPCRYANLFFTDSTAYQFNSVIVAIVNLLAAIPTILLNILVCVAFARKALLRRNGNKVLFSLSLSDLLSGLLIQPVLSSALIIGVTQNPLEIPCELITFAGWCGHTLACVSLLTLSLISLERYLAIFHPYFYNRHISSRFLYIICSSLWVFSIVGVFIMLFLQLQVLFYWVNFVIIIFTYLWNIFVYIRIVSQVRKVQKEVNRMRNRFQTNTQTNGTATDTGAKNNRTNEKQSKGTKVAGAIIISLLLSYLPQVLLSIFRTVGGVDQRFMDYYLEYWSFTFALLNPCLNPIFYCYYNTDIRKEVTSLLRFRKALNRNKIVKMETGITNMNYSHGSMGSTVDIKRNSSIEIDDSTN